MGKGDDLMKVIGINGSARKDGNTAILIKTIFDELNKEGIETEMIQFAGHIIEPCKACWACGEKGNCVHHNDIFTEAFQKICEADGMILGSPVYSANVSANMQAFLERAAVVADCNSGILRHKVGAAVAVARRAGAINTVDTMNHLFQNHEMFIAGSGYWNVAYGRLSGDVLQDEEGINTMKTLGRNMAHLLKALGKE